jgi:hypothetical protein
MPHFALNAKMLLRIVTWSTPPEPPTTMPLCPERMTVLFTTLARLPSS